MSKTKRLGGKRAIICCLLLFFLFLLLPQATYAASLDEAEITVTQTFTTSSTIAVGAFNYELRATAPASPMPVGSIAGVYSFTLTGAADSTLLTMKYPAVGTFHYTLQQVVASPQAGYTYDAQVYSIEVTVVFNGAENIAIATVKNSLNTKVTAAVFASSYNALPGPTTFLKKVKDPVTATYTGSITITDVNAPLDYKVELQMPALMTDYTAVALVDELPSALELWDTATPSNCVRLTVGGTDVTTNPAWGTLAYNPITRQVTYTFVAAQIPALAGQAVTMTLSTRIIDSTVSSIRNKAKLITNALETPQTETPDSFICGVIEGYLWEDANANGLQDIGEGAVSGETVELQRYNGTQWVVKESTTTTAAGTYRFESKYDTYRVAFPRRTPKVFTIKHASGTPASNDSDANSNSFTDAVLLSGTQQQYKLDAGYVTIALPSPHDVTKVILNGNQETDSLSVMDPREDIEYIIRVQLGSLAGYHSLELADSLDSRLNYKAAQVFVNGQNITAKGALNFDRNTGILNYTFATPLDAVALENQTVELRLIVSVKNTIASFEDIHNSASVIVNGGQPILSKDNPKLMLKYGYIAGYVFEDTNINGLRDDPAANYLLGMNVRLESYSNGTWATHQTTTAAADGSYVFYDSSGRKAPYPFGKYRVSIEDNSAQFIYAEKNKDGTPYSGNSSDADPTTGLAEVQLTNTLRHPVLGIGLVPKKAGEVPEPKDPPIQKFPSTQRANPGDSVNYAISGFGNNSGKAVRTFSVTDVVPMGLDFTTGNFPAFSNGSKVVYDVQYITNYNSSYRVMHSGISASAPFSFAAPPLQAGERITMITLFADSVPAGFGVGNTINFAFIVAPNAPRSLTNSAILSKGDHNTRVNAPLVDTNTGIEVPDEEGFPEVVENYDDVEPPLSNPPMDIGEWSLLNMILVLLGLVGLIILGVRAVNGQNSLHQNEGTDEGKSERTFTRKTNPVLLTAGIAAWGASAVLALATQNFAGSMVLADRWTIFVAILITASLVTTLLSSRKALVDDVTPEKE